MQELFVLDDFSWYTFKEQFRSWGENNTLILKYLIDAKMEGILMIHL